MLVEAAYPERDAKPHECIFCDYRGKLSREHYEPQWLTEVLPPRALENQHGVQRNGIVEGGLLHGNTALRKVRTLRVVCAACNNGWMSRLQTAVITSLSELAKNGWRTPLTPANAEALSKWAIMTTMVYEFDFPDVITIRRDVRHAFARTLEIGPGWQVYLGNYVGRGNRPKNYFPFCMKINGTTVYRQTTTFTAGRVVFHVVYFSHHALPDPEKFGLQHHVKALHPSEGDIRPSGGAVTFRDIGAGVGLTLARAGGYGPASWWADPALTRQITV